MAVQKHNTYYDSELYYYDENGVRQPLQVGKVYSAGSGIKIENDIISVSGKYLTSADPASAGKQLVLKDNKWEELILPPSSDWLPTIKEASANSYTAATAWTDAQHYLTAHQVIPSAKWENASNVVSSYSANGKWLIAEDVASFATTAQLNTASSTLTGQTNYLSGKIAGITADVDYLSGQIDNKLDKSIYVNASSKWENASDKVDASSNFWNSVYDTVNDNSAKWDAVAESANYWNLTYNEFTANSGNWNETTQKVNDSADIWNTVTAKADKEDLDDLRDEVETVSSFIEEQVDWLDEAIEEVSGDVQKISADVEKKLDKDDFNAWSAQTTTWDVDEYTGIDPIKVDNHEISLTAKYLSANALDSLSGKWEDAANNLSSNSAKWNSVYDTVDTNSSVWDTVVDKADQEDLETLSGELDAVSSFIEDQVDWLKEAIDEVSGDVGVVSAKVNTKLDTTAFESWSAQTEDWDVKPYVAGDNVTIDPDHTINSKDWTNEIEEASANAVTTVEQKFEFDEYNKITAYNGSAIVDTDTTYQAGYGLDLDETTNTFSAIEGFFALSGDVYNQEEVDEKLDELKEDLEAELAKFGFYVCKSNEVKPNGEPDETILGPAGKLSTQKIYLVLDSTAPTPDQYKEWIWDESVWTCIGDTSMSLSEYLTKAEAERLYQKKLTAGNHIDITNDIISVSGLHNTTLTSTNGSIGITATTAANGDVEYDLGVRTIPSISGINGVSAYYDETEDQYVVGLDDYNDIGFAKYSSDTIYYTANDNTLKSLHEDLNLNQEKIALVEDKIILQPGLYHVDMQVLLSIGNSENVYYETTITTTPAAAAITQIIDASYEHNETIDLSFDIKIANATELNATITDFQTGSTYQLINLNIHEIVSMPSQVEGGAGNYVAGRGISIDNDTIEAKIGNGLEFQGNNIQVKLGEGLKFDNSQGVQAVTIDNDVEAVVNTVQKMEEDLDTKVTVNFDYANITDKFDFSTYGDTTGQGNLLGYLFAVPINNKIYAESSVDTSGNPTKYVTKIGVYSHQTYTQNYIILGLYEYDPNFPQTDAGGTVTGYGRTVPFCDTGARQLSQGLNEFTITHLNDLGETTPELKSSCLYYATIYISKNPGNGVNLAGCPGYATTFNTNPQITLDQTNVNINLTDTNPVPGKTRDQVSFNDMGWGSWAGQQNYHELPSAPRFFMQISNKVRPTI